jgi:threonine dehydrogenase-like Zn-dependent dehydrogenase
MRAVVVAEPGRLEIRDVPEPKPGHYQVRVRTLAGGLCGTDRHILDGTFYRRAYPAILGHESLGRVVETGPAVRNFAVGDMILRTTAVRPGEELGGFGSMLGGFAEWALATDTCALAQDGRSDEIRPYDRMQQVVPAEFDPADAGAFIVFKETLSWLRRLTDVSGRRVLIIGTGAAAVSFVRVAKLDGSRQVIVLGRRQEKTGQALRLGADDALIATPQQLPASVLELTDGHGVDVVVEAAGATDALEAAPDCLAPGGIVGVYGLSPGQAGTFRWGWDRAVPRRWSLRFEEPDEAGVHDDAWRLVAAGAYDLKANPAHIIPFADIRDAFELMKQPATGKVAIDFSGAGSPR